MPAKKSTPTFVTEYGLETTPHEDKVLEKAFFAGRQIYNAVLSESLDRLDKVRTSEAFKQALEVPRGSKERNALFNEADHQYGFTKVDLEKFAKEVRYNGDFKSRIDSTPVQEIAARAFDSARSYALGKKGRPRFQVDSRFRSVAGKSADACMRWKNEGEEESFGWRILWLGLRLKPMINPQDKIHMYGLGQPVKFVRIVRKKWHGEWRYYAQLVHEGYSYWKKKKHPLGSGVVGIDIGPSTIAIVAPEAGHASLRTFCEELERIDAEARVLQRQIDRQRRAGNPDNYRHDGTIRKGKKRWQKSKSQRKTEASLEDKHRKLSAYRDSLHGRLVNKILALGDTFMLEDVSYKSFQRNCGKSTSFRAPGKFVERLKRKAERAGAKAVEFSTFTTALSQSCICKEERVKKSLSNRWHECECGVSVQRDVWSAFLACFVRKDEDGVEKLVREEAKKAFPGVDARLRAAQVSVRTQTTTSKAMPEHPGSSGLESFVAEVCYNTFPEASTELASVAERA